MRKFIINKRQRDILYSIYFNQNILIFEYYSDADKKEIDKTIKLWFEEADEKEIPFSLQNLILHLAKIKKYNDCYFDDLLKNNNITIA